MLAAKSLTAIAIRMTPNTFLITFSPAVPSILSILREDFRTAKTKTILIIIAMMMFSTWYSARKDKIEVSVPAPAISGNAIGTTEALSGSSSL